MQTLSLQNQIFFCYFFHKIVQFFFFVVKEYYICSRELNFKLI